MSPAAKKRKKRKSKRLKAKPGERKKIKQKAVEYKGGKCETCGYDKCLAALTFHHKDPNKKNFAISSNAHRIPWHVLQKELDGCKLLCANCHHELHHNEHMT